MQTCSSRQGVPSRLEVAALAGATAPLFGEEVAVCTIRDKTVVLARLMSNNIAPGSTPTDPDQVAGVRLCWTSGDDQSDDDKQHLECQRCKECLSSFTARSRPKCPTLRSRSWARSLSVLFGSSSRARNASLTRGSITNILSESIDERPRAHRVRGERASAAEQHRAGPLHRQPDRARARGLHPGPFLGGTGHHVRAAAAPQRPCVGPRGETGRSTRGRLAQSG